MIEETLQLDRDNPVPLYCQLKRVIENDIKRLGLKPGERLPSEYELVKRYKVSRTLIRQTFNVLINEGIVSRIQGKGSFVSDTAERKHTSTGNLGFILCERKAEEPIYSYMLNSCEAIARQNGRHLIFSTLDNFYSNQQLPKMILERTVDGVIVTGDVSTALVTALKQSAMPFVMIGLQHEQDCDLTIVAPDEFKSQQQMFDLLHKNGHKRILLLRGPGFPTHNKAEEAFLGSGGTPDAIIKCKSLKSSEAYELILELFKSKPEYTAIFASDCRLASGALDAIRERGLKVPDDISLSTAGGLDLSSHTNPPLTDAAISYDDACQVAMQKLLGGIKRGRMEKGVFITDHSHLIIRKSVKNILTQECQ